jgi:HTH-type transcriptional regulator/antitoxin HigA
LELKITTDEREEAVTEDTIAEAFPAGEYLKDELDERGWTQAEFAEIIGRPVKLVNEIINGKAAITPTTATEIGAALDTGAMVWLNLEATYRLWRAGPAPKRISQEAKLRSQFPVREIIKRGWIPASENAETLQSNVYRFWVIESEDERPKLAYAAKKSAADSPLTRVQEAWLLRVIHLARGMPIPPFNEGLLRSKLDEIHACMIEPQEIRRIPSLLAECGVRLVIVEPLPGSAIDGVTTWLDPKSPVIGLSLLRDRIDNFWFVLRHEIEHVLRKDGRSFPVVDQFDAENQNPNKSAEELAANEAAAEFCVPQADLDEWITRVKPIYSDEKLLGFAAEHQIHPGIVAGQVRNRLKRWNLFTKYLEKVRPIITRVAITDGYGQLGKANT